MRRTAIVLAASFCAAFAAPTAAVASGQPGVTAPAPEGVVKNAAGEVVGGWKALPTDTQSSPSLSGSADASTVATASSAEVFVGGGTWHYGTYVDSNNYKHCWSFYYHPSVTHSATADMTLYDPRDGLVEYGRKVKTWAAAGAWANAEPTPAPRAKTGTCYVYWGKA